MHTVEIDYERINTTFENYANPPKEGEYIGKASTSSDSDDEYADAQQTDANAWREESVLISCALFRYACPGWDVDPAKQMEFAEALATVLRKWFPTGPMARIENLGPVTGLLFVTGSIAFSYGFDWSELSFKPLRAEADTVAPGPSDGAFTTEGGSDESN